MVGNALKPILWLKIAIALVLWLEVPAKAGPGHGHGNDFGSSESNELREVEVEPDAIDRLGIRVETLTSRLMDVGITVTGEIEATPDARVEVTSPVAGTLVQLLVEPGETVVRGEPLAVLSSPELAGLAVDAQRQQAEAEANVLEAQANLQLARDNYQRQLQITEADIASARSQLETAQSRYDRDRQLVESGGVLSVAQENYKRQQDIAEAEIDRAETEVAVAREQYEKDVELVEAGAIPRRQMLESRARLAAAEADLSAAVSRREVLTAQSNVRQAEVDLPVRDLRESEDLLAQARSRLTQAEQRRELGEAQAEIDRAEAALEVARARLDLSDDTYAARLRQLGATANPDGTVTIAAPIAGTVSARTATLGQSVDAAGAPLMQIVNSDRVWVRADVYVRDLPQIQRDRTVLVRVRDVGDRLFRGRVAQIDPVVEGEQRVPVRAEIDRTGDVLKPGMFAEVEIVTDRTAQPVLAIPTTAIVEVDERSIVYVREDRGFKPVEVELGRAFGEMVEVERGLADGDRIVTQGGVLLYAQSLRGGGDAHGEDEHGEDEHGEDEHGEDEHGEEEHEHSNARSRTALSWAIVPVLGGVAGGGFWFLRRRRNLPFPELLKSVRSRVTSFSTTVEESTPERDSSAKRSSIDSD
ncbi:efflux RND transporter periplasmic adaptor subunit [Geitlerinema sp. CS-897]|nr:efflux RND transporter periplasmic adaptor subunit [Geitlerinema sp. CS-897]